ncbi:MAG: hypothetical protein AAGC88_14925 [Bacteroidota bacterium]
MRLVLVLAALLTVVLGYNHYYAQSIAGTFYQPQDALETYAPKYKSVFDQYAQCARIDCKQSIYDELIANRDTALKEDWPELLSVFMSDEHWRRQPDSGGPQGNVYGPWVIRDGFWRMVETLGGVDYVRENCTPDVYWEADPNRRTYRHDFHGLRCAEEYHSLSSYFQK